MYPEVRIERLFEWIEQSAHYTPGPAAHSQSFGGMNTPSPRKTVS